MAISIPSVTVLKNEGVNVSAAVVRQASAQEIIASAEKESASPSSSNFSSVSLISSSGKARLSLESFQAQAEALQNASAPPTLSDFKLAVLGVVSSFGALRTTLSNALVDNIGGARAIENAKAFADRISAGNREDALSLSKKIGVETQADGSLGINQRQLVKSFNDDSNSAFSALKEFAAKLAEAKDTSSPNQKDSIEKSKEAMRREDAAARKQEADQAQQSSTRQGDESAVQASSVFSAPATSFTAQAAVTSYSAVAAL
jgi:hypothetical protein